MRAERADEVVGGCGLEDGVDDPLVVPHAVVVLVGMRVQQLVDDVVVVMGMALRTLERV